MKCQEYEESFSPYYDGELNDDLWLTMDSHMQKCGSCSKKYQSFQESAALTAMIAPELDLKAPLELDADFTKNVMARVKLLPNPSVSSSSFIKNALIFAALFCVYIMYALTQSKFDGLSSARLIFAQHMFYLNTLFAILGIAIFVFTKELANFDHYVIKKFWTKYPDLNQLDYKALRFVGAALVFGAVLFNLLK